MIPLYSSGQLDVSPQKTLINTIWRLRLGLLQGLWRATEYYNRMHMETYDMRGE